MVLRTEGMRAQNMGKLDAMKQSGKDFKKYIYNNRYFDDGCHVGMNGAVNKYSESNAIKLDKNFVVRFGNKTVTVPSPPFHPNCRCEIGQVGGENDIRN